MSEYHKDGNVVKETLVEVVVVVVLEGSEDVLEAADTAFSKLKFFGGKDVGKNICGFFLNVAKNFSIETV